MLVGQYVPSLQNLLISVHVSRHVVVIKKIASLVLWVFIFNTQLLTGDIFIRSTTSENGLQMQELEISVFVPVFALC